jgi:hypothetical protein
VLVDETHAVRLEMRRGPGWVTMRDPARA